MKFIVTLAQIILFIFIAGCSSKDESINRLLYESGQSYDRNQCLENPSAECGSKNNFEEYQRERKEALRKEYSIRAVAQDNLEPEPCPYPAAPINWILRYCAFANQTGDEIALQQSECFEKAQSDLNSKNDSCQIKEKYKLKYCQEVVEKHGTHKTVQLCLEDHSVKPFFAGN